MKKYYLCWLMVVLGIIATPMYLYVHAVFGNEITLFDLIMPLGAAILAGASTYRPVSIFSVFTVNGSVVQERRIGKKNVQREADLNDRNVRLYLWVAYGARWLIVTTEACERGKVAKELYKQNKAVMIPYEWGLRKLLQGWVDKAKEIP